VEMKTEVDDTANTPKSFTRSPSSNWSLLKKYVFSVFLGAILWIFLIASGSKRPSGGGVVEWGRLPFFFLTIGWEAVGGAPSGGVHHPMAITL